MSAKIVRVRLDGLKLNLFVRKELNQDHVLYLAELVENGVKLPPIKITSDGIVVDGRHRIACYELCDIKEIDAWVDSFSCEAEMIAEAYKANVGGPLPPSQQDTEHTIMLLTERRESKKRIAELLGLPIGIARRYVDSVVLKTTKAKLQRAANSITEGGLTVAKAAEQYEVEPEKLKEVLSGHRRKQKQGIPEVQRSLTRSYKSLSSKNAHVLRSILEKYEDGDVTANQTRDIFRHFGALQRQSARAIADWEKRFEAMTNGSADKKVNVQ